METLSLRAFDALYQDVVTDVLRLWTPAMQEELIVHCRGWGSGGFDLERHLRGSSIGFHHAYRSVCAGASGVCDVGGFWGVFPITLRRLGLDAAMIESLRYYGDTFDPLFDHIAGSGVEIIDYDPFIERPTFGARFDAVTVMSGLDRSPSALRWFMENVTALMKPGGMLYIGAPNAAYLPKRVARLLGHIVPTRARETATHPIADGEFTLDELHHLAALGGLTVTEEHCHNSSRPAPDGMLSPLESLLLALLKGSRECVGVACRENGFLRRARREREERLQRRRVADGVDADGDAILVASR